MKTPHFMSSLKFKILAGALGLISAFGCAVMGNIHGSLSRMLKEELTRRGTTIAHAVSDPAGAFLATDDYYVLHRLLREAAQNYDDVRYLYVVDAQGEVRAHTFPEGFPQDLIAGDQVPSNAASRIRIFKTEEGLIQDIAVPLSGGRLGSVHVGMKEHMVCRRIARFVAFWGVLAACILLLGMAIAYWLTDHLTRRLLKIVEVTRSVGAGQRTARVHDTVADEVGELGRAFNVMIDKVQGSQELLLRSAKLAAIGELASSVAHEINNPLSTVAVCVDSLMERAEISTLAGRPELEAFPRHLKTASEEVFRCKKIIEALLEFSRHKGSRKAPTDINVLANNTLALVSHRARKANASLSFSPSASPLVAEIDADQIKQVLLNLLLNALDHLPSEGGSVLLSTQNGDNTAEISVEDNGSGISLENISRVFEPFFTTKPPGRGTGLGLAICRRIMDEHSGAIEVHSRPGEGARFVVTLPVASSNAPRPEVA